MPSPRSSGPRRSTTPGGARPAQQSRKTLERALATKKKRRGRGFLKFVAISSLVLAIVGALTLVVLYNVIEVPNPNSSFQAQTTNVYYSGGKTRIGKFAEQDRESIPLEQMPQHLQDAVVAAEDRTFWTNRGIDVKGIIRAALSNARGNSTQGASTITQQYVKILYLTSERTLTRKVKEAVVSLKLQQQQGKKEILKGYLNTIYFGRGAYGIQAASRAYFRKPAKDLTVAQSAVLASVLNSPNNFDPRMGEEAKARLFERYRYVLNGMVTMGTLDSAERDRLIEKLPKFPKIKRGQTYAGQKGFMLELVKAELRRKGFDDATIEGGGLKVTTTFDKTDQSAMERGIAEQRPTGPFKKLHIGGASIDVKTGALRAIYGGQDYLTSPYNWALKGGQPGSTFKAFAVATALKEGYSLKDTFEGNSPYEFPDGTTVRNEGPGDGNDYGSAISLTKATEESVNTAFMDLTFGIPNGPKKILDTADDMGIPVAKTDLQANAGVSLGTERVGVIDMVNGYSTIANQGKQHSWYVVQKVQRISDGKTLYTAKGEKRSFEAIDADVAADTSYALQQVVSNGTGRAALSLGRPAAGKTGTATAGVGDAQHVSSAWFIGYTPQVATGIMYVRGDGNDQIDGWLPEYFGGSYPARTWTAVMRGILEGLPIEQFPPPANLDGEAPESGHAPYVPPAQPARKPRPKPKPKPKPQPSSSPTPEPSPTQTPSGPGTNLPPANGNGNGNGGGRG